MLPRVAAESPLRVQACCELVEHPQARLPPSAFVLHNTALCRGQWGLTFWTRPALSRLHHQRSHVLTIRSRASRLF